MKKTLAFIISTLLLVSCASHGYNKLSKEERSNKKKAVAVLNSLETRDPKAFAFVNQNKYIQHNLNVGDGVQGLQQLLQAVPKGAIKVNVVRAFADGDYVFTHTEYDFFGPKVGFDIFRFENGKIVEHWDNLQEIVSKTASGRSQIDGPTRANDLEKTKENKLLIKGFVNDVLMGGNPGKITDYISTEKYYQHNPAVGDGLAALGQAMEAMAKAGTPMVYSKNHMILGQGNFVLTVSEGQFLGKHSSFYDLFRIENGKIVEHWDTIETILPRSKWKNDNGKF